MIRRRLLRLGPTTVYIHTATLLFALYWGLVGKGMLLVISMLSICLHEAAHAVVSALWGAPPQELELTPLGMLMRLEDDTKLSPGKRLTVLLAGPVMSLLLCGTAIVLTKWHLLPVNVGRICFACNLLYACLNLLPALPLDGGRILSMLLGLRLKNGTIRKIMRIIGSLLGISLIGLNVWFSMHDGGWNLSMSIAGCFLIYAASAGTTTAAMAELRQLMDRKIRFEKKRHAKCCWVAVDAQLPVGSVIRLLAPGRYTMFLLVEPGSYRVLGQADEGMVFNAYWADPAQACKELISMEKTCAD